MSLFEQISIEDNQRNQKSDQIHHQTYHHHSFEESGEEQATATSTSTSVVNNAASTTSTSKSKSISLQKSSGLDFLSSPPSPLGPRSTNAPLTSTPLTLTLSTSTEDSSTSSVKSNQILVSESNTITTNTKDYSFSEDSSSSITNTKVAVESKDPIVPRDQEAECESEPQSASNTLASTSSKKSVVNVREEVSTSSKSVTESNVMVTATEANSATSRDSAITIIQVQSISQQPEEDTMPKTKVSPTPLQETDLDTDVDVDGLAVTRIKISGADKSQQRQPSPHPVVKVTVLNGSGQEVEVEERSGSVTPTNATNHSEDMDESTNSRGPVRFDEGLPGLSRSGGGGGSQPSELNDTVSEISSVVNNPSVISALPDRYGFMGGEQYTHESEPDPSPEIVRRREMKWLQMMEKWDHFMRKDFKTVRSRCRKGIPRSVRGRSWYYLCGAAFIKKKDPDLYFRLLQQEGKASDVEDIKKDLHRQFPWHEIFAEEGHGKKDLFNVLKAHSILNAKDGYCQAQAPVASILLMHMPAEDAFWCLVAICDKYLKGYYSPGMEQLQLDGDILFGLLKRVAPPVYKHMKKQKIDPVLYMTEWFLCAFTRTLPWASVLRVWDSFLCEGVKVLFRVGLILLKYSLGRPGVLKQCPSMYETLSMLKNLPNYVTHEQFLVAQIQRMDVSDDQMRREHYKQVVKRKKAQQKLEAAKKQQQKHSGRQQNPSGVYRSHETSL